jgi:kynureninase
MHCISCGMNMRYLGMGPDGRQYFECHQDSCEHQRKPLCRWWESGTDFQVEFVAELGLLPRLVRAA